MQGCVEQGVVSDLLAANKLVRLQRRFYDRGLKFEPSICDPVVVTFTDASRASRRDGSSQGGQITVLMERKAVQGGGRGLFSVQAWSSRQLRRVARSSTSAETQMLGNGLDFHEFAKVAYLDMNSAQKMDLRDVDQYSSRHESFVVSDAKNAYDALAQVETSGLHMEETYCC